MPVLIMIEYKTYEGPLTPKVLSDLATIYAAAFGEEPPEDLEDRINQKGNLFTVVAYDGDEAIAFKLGYERNQEEHYSWLGGVLADYRRRGIATELMHRQHSWLMEHKFKRVITETENRWRSMMILNLKCGFDIRGAYIDDKGLAKIIMSKDLTKE